MRRASQFLAGAVLSLATLKFHLILLLPVFLISRRRWRMLAGFATAATAIFLVCLAAAGPGWILNYLHFALQGQTNPNVHAMPNLRGLHY